MGSPCEHHSRQARKRRQNAADKRDRFESRTVVSARRAYSCINSVWSRDVGSSAARELLSKRQRKRSFRKVAARVCGRIGMQNAPSAEPAAIEVSRFESKAMASSYSAMDVSDKVEDPEGPILTLWCSGDAPDSAQQHNFEGVWTLHRNRVHRRPVYEHIAPDGTPVYLYSVEQSAGHGHGGSSARAQMAAAQTAGPSRTRTRRARRKSTSRGRRGSRICPRGASCGSPSRSRVP